MQSKETITNDLKIVFQNEANVIWINAVSVKHIELKSADDFLSLKFNLMNRFINKYNKVKDVKKYKDFFEPENEDEKNKNIELVKDIAFAGFKDSVKYLGKFLNIKLEKQIDLSDITKNLESDNSKITILKDHDLIKIFKGIYRLSQKDINVAVILGYIFNSSNIDKCFSKGKQKNFVSILNNINKLQCDDQEFQEFQKQLQNYTFGLKNYGLYVRMKNIDYENNNVSKFYNKIFNAPSVSRMKLFLLIATVLCFVVTMFFAVNLILAFLAITQTLAIILDAIATVAFITFLIISIKYDTINLPKCWGGNKSFIDLYQNTKNNNEEPEKDKNTTEKDKTVI